MGNDIKTKDLLPLTSEDMGVDFVIIPFSLVGEVLKSRHLEAIKHTQSPQLILAGAGKTMTITAKIAYMVEKENIDTHQNPPVNLKYNCSYK